MQPCRPLLPRPKWQVRKNVSTEHRTTVAAQGTEHRSIVAAQGKNDLENYCFTMHDFLEQRSTGLVMNFTFFLGYGMLNATLDWLDENQLAEGHEFKAKQKELVKVVNQIRQKELQQIIDKYNDIKR